MEDKAIVNQIIPQGAREISKSSTLEIDGAPISMANATITKAYRMYCFTCHRGIPLDTNGV